MKRIVGFCLLIVSVLLSVSCTFAASGFGGGSRGDGWGSGGFSTGTTSTEVSYDALSSLALELNDRLASGEFGDVLKEVSCNIGVYSTVSGRDKYAIFYHYQASNYWYRNASGGLVYAYKDIDRISDLLGGNNGGIAYFLNRMEYVLTGSLLTAVNSINTATNSLLTTCNTISTKLDTLTSVISNGKVLVDNSDVVSAIQSIPAYDDTEITGYVGSITEFLNLFSRTYNGNYTKMLQQVTFLDESLAQLRKHVITGNRHTSEIIDMLTAAVDADSGKLLVADTAVTSAIAALADSLSIPAPIDYTSQLTAVVEKLDALANKSAVDLTTIESTLSTISDKLDNTTSDVNNTIINITKDNDYFSVFYITDGDGNTQSVTDFAGALTGASGKLLSLLYRLVFADALGSVDGDLGNMEDFFTSEEPPPVTAAMNGDTAPANEVIDVWAS